MIVAAIGALLGGIGLYGDYSLTLASEDMLELSKTSSSISSILNSHYTWRHGLSEAVYAGMPFTGSLDSTACSLGTWLRSDEAREVEDPEVVALIGQIIEPHNFIHDGARRILSHFDNGEFDEGTRIFREEVLPRTQEVISGLQRMNDRYGILLSDKAHETYNLGRTFSSLIIVFIITALIISIILALLITSNIVKPIVGLTFTLKDVSEGNLTKRINSKSKDEVGDLARYFNLTLDKIKSLIVIIKDEAARLSEIGNTLATNMNETASSINQITANIQSIKTRVINQSASVTETNATMEQVTSNINKLNDHVENQSHHISQASAAIEQMVANIQSVTDTLVKNSSNVHTLKDAADVGRTGLQDVASDIQEIARESEGLMEINAVMENIASQTNLLSMNAAIEAAHAGEAGKGFAVVADEIRKLAESSGEQSKTISIVLKKIKESIDKITKSTENVLNKFEDIDSRVKIVADQEANVLNAMEEQGEGSKQVLNGIEMVTETTHQVESGSNEMLEGAREVIQESTNLERMTQEITMGMNEMASGAEQINVAVDHVNQVSIKNRESINNLIKEVSWFKVE